MDAAASCRTPVVTVGNFDGVHLGHRRVLEMAGGLARSLTVPLLALTFRPHPAVVLTGTAPPRLSTDAQQEEALASLGVDALLREPFDHAMATLSAEAFYRDVLCERLRARGIVVGSNFRFGAGRRGDVGLLASLASADGASGPHVVGAPAVNVGGEAVSSTRIRRVIAAGDIAGARPLLGRPWSFEGVVVRGDGRGRSIGVPTANLKNDEMMTPPPGVHACVAHVRGIRHAAACNVGTRPTFGPGEVAIEAHVIGFDGDLYGQTLRLGFLQRLRGERAFPSADALVAQLRKDIASARAVYEATPREELGPAGGW